MKNVILFKSLWLEELPNNINDYININQFELVNTSSIYRDGGYYVVMVTVKCKKEINNSIIINGCF